MNRVITIGREYGSGGREVGIKLAEALGIPFYDKEIITMAAEAGGLNEQFLANHEEKSPSFTSASFFGRGDAMSFYQPSFSDKIFFEQSEVIRNLAAKGSCVIVGRCADYVLRDEPTLNVFISASAPFKIARKLAMPEGKDFTSARMDKYVSDMDKHRRKYYEHYTGRDWGHTENYDICIRTDLVGVEGAVETLIKFWENIK